MDGLIRVDRRHRCYAPWCSALPRTCQPPAAPCQCTLQSLPPSRPPHPSPEGEGPRKDQPPHLPPVTVRVEAKKSNSSITFSDPNNPLLTKCRVGLTHPQIMLQFCDMYYCIIIQNALNKENTYVD